MPINMGADLIARHSPQNSFFLSSWISPSLLPPPLSHYKLFGGVYMSHHTIKEEEKNKS